MQHPGFFERAGPFSVADIAAALNTEIVGGSDGATLLHDIRSLETAGPGDLSFLDNRKYLPQFETTKASACLVNPRFAPKAPDGLVCLTTPDPYRAFAKALQLFYPEAGHPRTAVMPTAGSAAIDESAVLEEGITVEPGAVIGAGAHIGAGSRIAAGSVIGFRVHIGRDCYIGPNAVLLHTLVGNRVNIHSGAALGQDGFGFAMGLGGHLKVPQIGRVIVQDDVEIGANTTIDRGALHDTIIGEGTKIDNLVQIGHNVIVGRHCIIVAQTGISGSVELGDFVALGGKVGVEGHVKIGSGAQIAATSVVRGDVPPGARWGGIPAKPVRLWFREMTLLRQMAERKVAIEDDGHNGETG